MPTIFHPTLNYALEEQKFCGYTFKKDRTVNFGAGD